MRKVISTLLLTISILGLNSLPPVRDFTKCDDGQLATYQPGNIYPVWCKQCPPLLMKCDGSANYECAEGFSKVDDIIKGKWCANCPSGHACNGISENAEPCPAGTFPSEKKSKCIPCLPGKYSAESSDACENCPSNAYCIDGLGPFPEYKGNQIDKKFLARLAEIAEETYNDTSSIKKTMIQTPDGSLKADVTFENGKIIIAIRGSKLGNWARNLETSKVNTEICPECQVHEGFYKNYNELRNGIIYGILPALSASPKSEIYIIGHSMGGSVATIAAADLSKLGVNLNLVTFGSPRVGNQAFSNYVNKQLENKDNYRVTYGSDPFFGWPSKNDDFRHPGQEIHYTSNQKSYLIPRDMDASPSYSTGEVSIKIPMMDHLDHSKYKDIEKPDDAPSFLAKA